MIIIKIKSSKQLPDQSYMLCCLLGWYLSSGTTGVEITAGHHCGGETFQSISANSNLKSAI